MFGIFAQKITEVINKLSKEMNFKLTDQLYDP